MNDVCLEMDNPKTPLCKSDRIMMKYMGNNPETDPKKNTNGGKTGNGNILPLGAKIKRRTSLVNRRRWIVNIEFFLAMVGIIIMMIETELFIKYKVEKTSMTSFSLKCVISATTAMLLVSICMYYYTGAQIKAIDTGVKDWVSVISSWTVLSMTTELLVCSIHPFPGDLKMEYVSPIGTGHKVSVDAVLSIVMMSRLYLVAKFAVAHSRLLTDTSTHSIGALSKVKINTLFVFKAAMTNKPGQLLLFVMIMTFLVNCWAMRTCELYYERGNIEKNSYLEIMWLIAITFLTVGYGDKTPRSYCGRYISIVTGAMGVVTTALLVAIIARQLEQSRPERYVFNFVSRMQVKYRIKTAAANVIKATLRIWILRQYGDEFKREIRKYDDKLKQGLKEIKNAKEEMEHIGEDAVGIVDVIHGVERIGLQLEKKLNRIDYLEKHITDLQDQFQTIDQKLEDIKGMLLKR
ncbi:hypothetical protein FSP39_016356 [Pinctada imbricata]|uniref:Potassium channel domain-containing protein n=1 Tax=Pinctada imbricata TaxID=66713 RepID=A0AA88XJC2_PINIB|nr:hypothetical protein FSP39_016356 [Pinctada imbricata]